MIPHMDFADCIWSPHLKVDNAQLKIAQRRATRLVPDHWDRLRALNLPSLLYRSRRMDMIQTFGIMKGIDDLEASDLFTTNTRLKSVSKHTGIGWWMTATICREKWLNPDMWSSSNQKWMKRGKTFDFCTLPYRPLIPRASDLNATRRAP